MYQKRCMLTVVLAVAVFALTNAQTLFTCNNKPVSKQEFLKAFNKNPDTTGGNHAQKLREYLDMYINFKLKLQQAYDEKLNARDEFKDEGNNFKRQLTENYINEQANINQLVHEAFIRSQEDILLSEVFVAVPAGTDTVAAWKSIQDALAALNAGRSFEDVTTAFSTDETVKQAKGSMGYITVFTLPYEIENIVYALKPGTYSGVYRSSIGYHIFKNVNERTAAGKRKIQQVLFPVDASFSEDEKQAVKRTADSVYQLITKGASFDDMVQQFANPNMNAQTKGIATVSTGMYSSDFEKKVYGLQKPGDVTEPFATSYGYHIIKLLDVEPIVTREDDVVNLATLQQSVESDDRLSIAKSNLVQQWMALTKYKKGIYNDEDLWHYTDSALTHKKAPPYKNINGTTVLFSFAKKNITAADWVTYLQLAKPQAGPQKNYAAQLKDFTKQSCGDYYRNHIEDYNPAIGEQMIEFNEANLLFAVMDKHVWSKASLDSAALLQYYNAHKKNYTWQPGVVALVVTAATKEVLDSLAPLIKANPANWRNITGDAATADSSRYENGQLPVKQNIPMQPGFITTPEQNDAGDTYTMVYVLSVYPQPAQRNFDDAKGMVINDYQQVLEEAWLKDLKKKYPVKLNEDVVKGLE